ncbi:DUF488 domain-containing protein [Actinoalloteichus sp. AHMU CJ021]|uniref:Uncharacterized conserved protein YeaO, DUF488 family n=1 Tax=Actinoalloteichus caeruleus DSM 43889 TaxID=1120930 RepID=A0ABT1JDK3_ACTCY|nr:DUF488 family protein [Actinoalloteichus caeruleus]AUS81027.1 DUF488 domain-containing protein [Actinoalloteichus sp. AHMU CJ021]MCP2330498.1 Uncharacterized conserved protein YeaO, DUF488 family [Actinoalloteichus caeruleus DSM 43889]
MSHIGYRRVYEEPRFRDGVRVLVDRVWPRGMRREDAHLDEWLRAVAPSTELRHWYGHDPDRFPEFRRRYLRELREPGRRDAAGHLQDLARSAPVTLLTASRDLDHSQAAVLAAWLAEHTPESA